MLRPRGPRHIPNGRGSHRRTSARAASNFAFDAPRKARYLSLIYRTPRGLLFSRARITDFPARGGGTGHAFSRARAFPARSPRPRKRCPKQPRHFFTLFTIPAGCVIIPVGAIMDMRRFYGSGKILFVRVNADAQPSAAPRLPMLRRSRLGRREIFPPRAIGFFPRCRCPLRSSRVSARISHTAAVFRRSALTRRSRTVHAPCARGKHKDFLLQQLSALTNRNGGVFPLLRSSAFSTAPLRPTFCVSNSRARAFFPRIFTAARFAAEFFRGVPPTPAVRSFRDCRAPSRRWSFSSPFLLNGGF